MLNLTNTDPIQMGFWVPNRVWATVKYLVPLRDHMKKKQAEGTLKPWLPAIHTFAQFLLTNSVYRMWINLMIEQTNAFVDTLPEDIKKEIVDQDGDTLLIPDVYFLLNTLNEIIHTSPSFNETAQVGTPMNGLLAISMATEAGLALFHDSTFNAQFKPVLDAWNTFLKSGASLDKLDINDPEKPGSWISKQALAAGVMDQMQCDPTAKGYGFASWNDFFIREFVPGARPFQGSAATQINIGCETTPWEYRNNIALDSTFWTKDVNYSLLDLFAFQRQWAELFVNGQLYQGFLSATHYHRWNAPLTGKLVRSWVQPGTYFAQRPGQGEDPGTWEGTESQPYLGQVAARAIFIFQHPTCGYVALLCIGMVEVSTCVIRDGFLVEEGAPPIEIERGTEIGHFEFGGSTHMMLFQENKVALERWALDASDHSKNQQQPTPLGTVIATAL